MRSSLRLGCLTCALLIAIVLSLLPRPLGAADRDVLLEDLRLGAPATNDIYYRAERPGPVVRVVPWMDEDGRYSVLAITAVGWVYRAERDATCWRLVGNIFAGWQPPPGRCAVPGR